MILFISGQEIVFILFIVVMLFGADKIPEIARGLGQGMKYVKNATNEIKREINESAEKSPTVSEAKKDLDQAKKQIDELTDSVKRQTRI